MFAKSVLSFGTMAGSIELGNLTWTEWWPCPFQIYPRASDVFLPKIMKLASKKAQKMGQKIVKLLNNPWSWNLLSTYPLIEWPPTYFFTIYIILYLAGTKARKRKLSSIYYVVGFTLRKLGWIFLLSKSISLLDSLR